MLLGAGGSPKSEIFFKNICIFNFVCIFALSKINYMDTYFIGQLLAFVLIIVTWVLVIITLVNLIKWLKRH